MEYIIRFNEKIKEYIGVPNDVKFRYIVLLITSYLIGTINFYETFSVFSIALYVASIKNKTCTLLYSIVMLLSCIQTGQTAITSKLILIMFFTFLLTYNVKKNTNASLEKMNIYKIGLMYGTLYFMLSVAILALNGKLYTYSIFLEILSSLLIFTMSVMLNKTYRILTTRHKINIIEKDTIISIILYLILTLVSMQGKFIYGIYIQEVMILLILEVVAYTMGEIHGGIAGTIITVPIILSGGYQVSLSILSFIGIIMGMLKNINKYLFAMIYTAITYILFLTYADSLNLSITFISNLIVTQMIFLIIPSSGYEKARQKIEDISRLKKKVYYEKVKDRVNSNMQNESQKLKNFANTLEEILDVDSLKEKNELLIDGTIKKVCTNCVMREKCWKENFYTTYTTIMEIFRKVEEKKEKNLIVEQFKKSNCSNYISMINQLVLDHNKQIININNENRNNSIKSIFSKFAHEISDRMFSMSNDINDYKIFRTHLEEEIYNNLIEKDINVIKVNVMQEENNKYEVDITIEMSEDIIGLENDIMYEISKVIKRKVKIIKRINEGCNEISYKVCEKENISLDYGIFQMSKRSGEDNGDKYSILKPSNNMTMLAISDGMGKGKKACEKSKSALKMLECLISLNLEEKFMIELINAFLLNEQEMFTTLDLCVIDLYNSKAKFMKSGCVSSYIKRKDNSIEKLASKSLPIGIMNESEVEIQEVELYKDDVIIMISDGVIDNINSCYEKETYLVDLIKKIDSNNAQEFTFNLGSLIAKNNILKEDMSILTARAY